MFVLPIAASHSAILPAATGITHAPSERRRPTQSCAVRLDFFLAGRYVLLFFRKADVTKLPEVESAKALMQEAMTWSVMRWMREKKRVRKTADRANELLDQTSESIKACWSDSLKAAYTSLGTTGNSKAAIDPEAKLIAKGVKEADDAAYKVRQDAEKTFDDAEKQLSTSLAREGCRKAIHGWELHEKAIRKAEAAITQ